MPVSPGASGMQPRDPGRPWRGTLASGHKPRCLLALQSLESNPQLSFATRMEDWTSLGQHKRHPEFPVVTRESRCNSRKSTWFPRHRKMKPFPATVSQEKSHVRYWRSKRYLAWTEHVQQTDAHVVGLSATPFSTGLGKIFTNLVNAATMHELTESGVLVPMRVFSCTQPDMRGAATSGGEWTDKAAEERGMEIIGDVVTEWCKRASSRKTIVFGATIAHCEEICRQFNEAGILAAVFTSKTPEGERIALLNEYKKPDSAIRVLISVEALAKGFDVKDVECVCDCRPLRKSLSTAIQMWGRGLRSSPETGKTDCYLLDFSGNIIRFAADYSEIFFDGLDALDAGEKLDKAIRRDDEEKPEGKACPACGFKHFARRCIHCGHEHQAQSLVEHLPGEMQEIRIGKTKYADAARHLYEQACTYARAHSAPEKQAGRAYWIFKKISGVEPSKTWRFEDTPNVPISRAVLNKIRQDNISYSKAAKK